MDKVLMCASLLGFIIALFIGYVYQRFYSEYEYVMTIMGRLKDMKMMWEGVLALHPQAKAHIFTASRHFHIAAMVAFRGHYVNGSDLYDALIAAGILTQEESKLLIADRYPSQGLQYHVVIGWAMQTIYKMEHEGWVIGFIVNQLVFEFRRGIGSCLDLEARPIPFAYFHTVNMFISIYLLTAIVSAPAGLAYICGMFIVLLFILSLQTIASRMATPIGVGPMRIDPLSDLVISWRGQCEFLEMHGSYTPEPATNEFMQQSQLVKQMSEMLPAFMTGDCLQEAQGVTVVDIFEAARAFGH